MSKKYIKQIDSHNFMYPNNVRAEYGIEIVHDLIEGQVSGNTTTPTLTNSGGNISISFNYNWLLNCAEPFINNEGSLNLLTVYFQTPDNQYFNPWMNVFVLTSTNTNLTSTGGTINFVVTPDMVNQTSFSTTGNYSVTVQFISRRNVMDNKYFISYTPAGPTPTQTPTPTPSVTPGYTPTPTPTPSATSGLYQFIGNGQIIPGPTNCTTLGPTNDIYLDAADYMIYQTASGCLSDGISTVAVIRNNEGNPIPGTFYFVWYGGSCTTTTFKSTGGNLTVNPQQC